MTWFIVPPLLQNLFMLLVIALSSSALATERERELFFVSWAPAVTTALYVQCLTLSVTRPNYGDGCRWLCSLQTSAGSDGTRVDCLSCTSVVVSFCRRSPQSPSNNVSESQNYGVRRHAAYSSHVQSLSLKIRLRFYAASQYYVRRCGLSLQTESVCLSQ